MNVEDGIVEAMASECYFEMDTYMKESDYNHLRAMLGYEEVHLEPGEYCIQTKPRIRPYLETFSGKHKIEAGGHVLSGNSYGALWTKRAQWSRLCDCDTG